MKRSAVVLALLAALTLTGCAGSTEAAPTETETVATVTTDETAAQEVEETEKMSAANSADITAPGEVCDPSNMNDLICAAFYPDQVVLNVTGRAPGDIAALSDAEKIELSQQACTSGGEPSFVTAGQLAYCPEQLDAKFSLTIAYYQGLGEEGAKADFADKTMPTDAEIGL